LVLKNGRKGKNNIACRPAILVKDEKTEQALLRN
jgi:hypothetical protein